MSGQYNRWERFYNQVNLWFNGTVALSIIPFGLAFLDTQSEFPGPPLVVESVTNILQVTFTLIAAFLVWLGLTRSKKQLAQIDDKEIAEKLQSYLSIKVKSFLILELAAVLGVIGLYLTKNQLFTGLYLAVMFVFSLTRPTFEKIAGDIRVSQKALTEWGKDQP
ncbi:MAG: hypothetical protein CMB80_29195 [Flammeovirgaceae bacterium]|nr:hypothetical protein [Flammeovirgaceae bacterium]MBE60904.1 hypothetical protein [Flammeovirgaceae bacterium]MBR09266.1 hypothetical protein [Rickettsiales bacterium]|tara:strand:- start:2519 stop:3010 length:492 start_codon:yes stop_codon:yes gene_type:complete